jgi:hypothetical protein
MREEWFAKTDIFRDSSPTIFNNESSLRPSAARAT